MRIRLTIEVDVYTNGSAAHATDVKGKFDAHALKEIINLYGNKSLVFLSSETISGASHRVMIDQKNVA